MSEVQIPMCESVPPGSPLILPKGFDPCPACGRMLNEHECITVTVTDKRTEETR